MSNREQQIAALEKDWAENPRWKGIKRGYKAADVVRLRGSFPIEHSLARRGAERLWHLVNNEPYVNCLGALTGGQAMQQGHQPGEVDFAGQRQVAHIVIRLPLPHAAIDAHLARKHLVIAIRDSQPLLHVVGEGDAVGVATQPQQPAVLLRQPAADVAEVRHGRWIFEPGKIPYCSECKKYSDDGDKGATFCPWCGARMGEEDEHEAD